MNFGPQPQQICLDTVSAQTVFFFKFFVQTFFFKICFSFHHKNNPTRTSDPNSKLFEPKWIVGDSKLLTGMSTYLSTSVHLDLALANYVAT